MVLQKTSDEIATMRELGRVVAIVLRRLSESIEPNRTTTRDLDNLALEILAEHGAEPAFKGYRGYPDALCLAVNEEVVHGIPSDRVLAESDIVGLDIGVRREGLIADGAWTYPVGEISREAQRLLNVTRESLFQGIAQAKPGGHVGDISSAIQRYVESHGYSVVRELMGHGVGRSVHEDPPVPNYGKPGTGAKLVPGMTICIEPMVNMGSKDVTTLDDGWTVVTKDRKLSAHFEHMIAITAEGADILTVE